MMAYVHCHRALKAGKDKPILLPHVLRDLLEEVADELNCPSLRDSAFSKYLAVCQEVALLSAQPGGRDASILSIQRFLQHSVHAWGLATLQFCMS